ncbi:AAA family ATPase [Micromonospora andamanensis]|uniref:Helicase n=1 Tax=Micromonospora andamanensis TaxID=1287068 RepID=A0ABQ4HY28_9ACTN|nr:AAA family ATPase [Micromonospora andamanensis]GIJ10573.1 helicase [Micromonospora andamanensis]
MTTPHDRAEIKTAQILTAFTDGGHRGVVVDSPPGAGKSTLVGRVGTEIAAAGDPVAVVAQTNAQVDDLVVKIANRLPGLPVGRLSRDGYQPPPTVLLPNVQVASRVDDLPDCRVVVGTAAKWAQVQTARTWPWAIVDEAYQMRSDMLLLIVPLFEQMLLVGDPGQLDPFSPIDGERWAGLPWDPMQSAVAVLLRNNPHIVPHELPVTWRLPASATRLVQTAFYPFSQFAPGTHDGERATHVPTVGIRRTAVDEVIDLAAGSGWGFLELPHRNTLRTDAETVAATADVAVRLLQRGTETRCEQAPGGRRLTAARIAVGAAHRDQVAAITRALRARGEIADGIRVDTANRLQGAEFDITVILHPLSGRIDATPFHLTPGRLCVLTSRHRHACIVVGRRGIPELLDAHPGTEPVHLKGFIKFPDGWEANQAVLAHLANHRVSAPH